KLMKKRADVRLLLRPTGAAKQKSRPRKRPVAKRKRKRAEGRMTKRGDGGPQRKLASDPNKRHSDAKTKSRGERSLNGRAKLLLLKLRRSPLRARSAFRGKRTRRNSPQDPGGGPGRRPKNRLHLFVARRRAVGQEKSQLPARSPTRKESVCAAWLRSAAPGSASGSGCIRANRSRS